MTEEKDEDEVAKPDTKTALTRAALLEFEEFGHDGTNSNRIARRAGFAPQTFYRHFKNKLEIFLTVYDDWVRTEFMSLAGMRGAEGVADLLIEHHRRTRNLRRSLRALAVTDPRVRAARRDSRLAQLDRLIERSPALALRDPASVAVALLVTERLADACAEEELTDLGLTAEEARAALIAHLERESLV
ncbi:MAG: TetR/AcrR family transcriptional regulator [Pseudooceanicola sp.]